VNLTGESKNFKMLDISLNKLQILSLTAFIFFDLNYKIVIFLSQTESTPKHFFLEKKHCIKVSSIRLHSAAKWRLHHSFHGETVGHRRSVLSKCFLTFSVLLKEERSSYFLRHVHVNGKKWGILCERFG
jgi:hypothetical protein